MTVPVMRLSRISKLFIDQDQLDRGAALARRHLHRVELRCGPDTAGSYTLQLASLTAGAIASRCFPGAAFATLDEKTAAAPLLVWPQLRLTFGRALEEIASVNRACESPMGSRILVFGDAGAPADALRVTFDGWAALVGRAGELPRSPEREYFSAAGVLAAALAVGELFFAFANISIEASRRTVGLSLWRPDLPADAPEALGIPVAFLPRRMWLLGLGHLGNGYLWTLSALPYQNPREVEFFLMDFDRVEDENVETGILFRTADLKEFKTRTCAAWAERLEFQTRLVERRLCEDFRRHPDEPGLAFSGFDSNPARRLLGNGKFARIVDAGLGGSKNNFDVVSFHSLPNPRSPGELWPDPDETQRSRLIQAQTREAETNPRYAEISCDQCGRFDLAGKAVAVPFVGAFAASLAAAEAVRMLHNDAPALIEMRFRMSDLRRGFGRMRGSYGVMDLPGLDFATARRL
jgi:hypothetical protein